MAPMLDVKVTTPLNPVALLPYASNAVTVISKGILTVMESGVDMVKWSTVAGLTVRVTVAVFEPRVPLTVHVPAVSEV